MIDEEQMKRDFIERRKKHNLHCVKKEDLMDEDPPLLIISYKNGAGKMVIDGNNFSKLPKSKQTKILKLLESD